MSDGTIGPPLELDASSMLGVLNQFDVEYVVIGGFALSAHWATRATKDIDIVPAPDTANLDRLWNALAAMHASPLPLTDFGMEEMPLDWSRDSLAYGGNWVLATDHGRLDILQYVAGVDGYEQLRLAAVDRELPASGRIWFAGKDDLIAMKRIANRPQDLIDIERIEQQASRNE